MDDSQIAGIVERARALPATAQGHYIARQAIAEARAADGRISPQAIHAEFRAWVYREHGTPPPRVAVPTWLAAWSLYLLRGGRE
jgi:hypothetical protein